MVYDLFEMMTGVWIEGDTLTRDNYGENFISQLADLLAEVHTTNVPTKNIVDIKQTKIQLTCHELHDYDIMTCKIT